MYLSTGCSMETCVPGRYHNTSGPPYNKVPLLLLRVRSYPQRCGLVMLLLTNHPHNRHYRHSPARHAPFRGVSSSTMKSVLGNEDAMTRLLTEFESVSEVASLRKCNTTFRSVVDSHSDLWKNMRFSPPGLSRFSRMEVALPGERVLRKAAQEGNREAQIMLAMMYHHGYRCPCHPLALPGAEH